MKNGKLVISLDFELMWGVRDKKTIEGYGTNILGVRKAIPSILTAFREYRVNATFATVGFLFFKNKFDLLKCIPSRQPVYKIRKLSPYCDYLENIGLDENKDPYHYGNTLIQLIKKEGHEISTHTFSHFYCLEEGPNVLDFEADLKKAIEVASSVGVETKSIIFPRNQYNQEYIKICEYNGLTSYRGNAKSWIYKSSKNSDEGYAKRFLRLLDSYVNISGYNTYSYDFIKSSFPYNIPSSSFLRPYNYKLKYLESLRISRIKHGMTYAAKNNRVFHLWWHPHNFGSNLAENMKVLNDILQHYKYLNDKYNFKAVTMTELTTQLT